jgi:hypothetical protein
VTKFVTSFYGGKKGLLENHVNLCQGTHRAKLTFKAQNGKVAKSSPAIGTGCKGK